MIQDNNINNMKSGVYKITNIVNGKFYIGSSFDIKSRTKGHLNDLRADRHCNNHLQRSFNKHGEDRFIFETLVYCPVEELLILEQYLMDFYQPQYNIQKTAGSPLGTKMSEETKEKLRILRTGSVQSQESREKNRQSNINRYKQIPVLQSTRDKLRQSSSKGGISKRKGGRPNLWQRKPIQQIDVNTREVINTFDSASEAAKFFGWGESSIGKAARGIQTTSGGFIWRYVSDIQPAEG